MFGMKKALKEIEIQQSTYGNRKIWLSSRRSPIPDMSNALLTFKKTMGQIKMFLVPENCVDESWYLLDGCIFTVLDMFYVITESSHFRTLGHY